LAQADGIGQFDIRAATFALKVHEDLQVKLVERHGGTHG
jgi:hypothetical protein